MFVIKLQDFFHIIQNVIYIQLSVINLLICRSGIFIPSLISFCRPCKTVEFLICPFHTASLSFLMTSCSCYAYKALYMVIKYRMNCTALFLNFIQLPLHGVNCLWWNCASHFARTYLQINQKQAMISCCNRLCLMW